MRFVCPVKNDPHSEDLLIGFVKGQGKTALFTVFQQDDIGNQLALVVLAVFDGADFLVSGRCGEHGVAVVDFCQAQGDRLVLFAVPYGIVGIEMLESHHGRAVGFFDHHIFKDDHLALAHAAEHGGHDAPFGAGPDFFKGEGFAAAAPMTFQKGELVEGLRVCSGQERNDGCEGDGEYFHDRVPLYFECNTEETSDAAVNRQRLSKFASPRAKPLFMTMIVFATCHEFPDIQMSDALVADGLEAAGVRVRAAAWNGDQTPFKEADMIVVRSTWDYPQDAEAFRRWLIGLGAYKTVVNGPALMHWNFTKRYLMRLGVSGAPLPPTRFVAPHAVDIARAMEELALERAVVKPVIGATASGLSIVERGDTQGLQAAADALGHAGLVQPLIPEIKTLGETSLIYIDGAFSHAVVKRPKDGDIRVQEEHGGVTTLTDAPAWAVKEGAAILEMLPEAPMYARVDAVILDERLQLMEVELIEPELFFTHQPEAADRFAAALLKKL